MGHLIHSTYVSRHLSARPVPAVTNERGLGRCGQDSEELQEIQGLQEKQQAFRGKGMGERPGGWLVPGTACGCGLVEETAGLQEAQYT